MNNGKKILYIVLSIVLVVFISSLTTMLTHKILENKSSQVSVAVSQQPLPKAALQQSSSNVAPGQAIAAPAPTAEQPVAPAAEQPVAPAAIPVPVTTPAPAEAPIAQNTTNSSISTNPEPEPNQIAPVSTRKEATIISVKPHYVSVKTPRRVCRTVEHVVYVQQPSSPSGVGIVVGGVAGGALGNALVHGNSRTAATIAGATVGALSGNAIQKSMNQPQPKVVYETVCSTQTITRKVQRGYEVVYSYNGKTGKTIMKNRPTKNTLLLPIQK